MSKFSEYIKLIPKGLKNLDKIIEGINNQVKMELGTLPETDENVIIGRRLICEYCPFNSKNATTAGWYVSSRTDEHCVHCGCPIKTKTASLDANCGIEEYNKQNPNFQIPLKWEKVK